MKVLRAAFASLVLSVALMCGCVHPTPATDPDVPVTTPSSWVDTADVATDVLTWSLPAARLVVASFSSTDPEKVTLVLRALDIAREVSLPGFQRALHSYRTAGGSQCAVRATGLGLVAALVAVTETLSSAGWGLAAPIREAVLALGGMIDELSPVCPGCAPHGPQTLGCQPTSRTIGDALARQGMRPFPPLHRPDVDAGTAHE